MFINVMRYRTGKFGVQAVEEAKNGKTINKSFEIQDMKKCFGEFCVEYRVNTKEGISHQWTFNNIQQMSQGLNKMTFPSIDNDEPGDD